MNAYKLTLFMHVGLGVAALLTYWVAALARKGSGPHKLAGKVYVLAMIGLLIPAIPLSVRILLDKSVLFGWFFMYLLLITGTAIWQGWFAIRDKRDFSRYVGPGYRRLAWANIAGGAAILGLGAATLQPILLGFSAVGVFGGRGMLQLAKNPAPPSHWWMEQHLGAMVACGVATHIAFLLVGLPRLLPGVADQTLQTAGWLGPLALSLVARARLNRKYLRGASIRLDDLAGVDRGARPRQLPFAQHQPQSAEIGR